MAAVSFPPFRFPELSDLSLLVLLVLLVLLLHLQVRTVVS